MPSAGADDSFEPCAWPTALSVPTRKGKFQTVDVGHLREQLNAIPEEMLDKVIPRAGELERVFEGLIHQVSTLTQGTRDPGGWIDMALAQLNVGKNQAADLCGLECTVRQAIETYTSQL